MVDGRAGKLFHLINVVGSVELVTVSVETTQLCHCSRKTPVQYVEEEVWLCMNKSFIHKNVRQALFADPGFIV